MGRVSECSLGFVLILTCGLVAACGADQTAPSATPSLLSSSQTPSTSSSSPIGSGVVIIEFASRNKDDEASAEFLELRNDSPGPVDLGGWRIMVFETTTRTTITYFTFDQARILGTGCHFLMATSIYPLTIAPDAVVAPGINDNSGIALIARDGTIADQVGMSPDAAYVEGTALAPFSFSNGANASYARIGVDTNDNARDFQFVKPATPRNASSSCDIR